MKHSSLLGLFLRYEENEVLWIRSQGRKKRNYPKRSAIIKTDPITGQLIYPGKSPEQVNLHFIKTLGQDLKNKNII